MSSSSVQIHTGNILNLSELKLLTTDREFAESIRLTLQEKYGKELDNLGVELQKPDSQVLEVNRGSPFAAVSADDIKNSRTSVKIFVKSCDPEYLKEAIKYIEKHLESQSVDSIILAYNNCNNKEKDPDQLLSELKSLWSVLEKLVTDKKVARIGLSDLHEDIFMRLYHETKVKPSTIQINLSSCCVVPPVLQAFAKSKEIQLVTHSDPVDILYQSPILSCFKIPNISLTWAVKYQAHVVCRGVLVSKGFMLNAVVD